MTIEDQPPPIPNEDTPVWDLVIEDMKARDRVGRERYGTPLQGFNGRDPLVDAYQEALDLVVYLRQELHERDTTRTEAKRVLTEAIIEVSKQGYMPGDTAYTYVVTAEEAEQYADRLLAAMAHPAVDSAP